MSPDASCGVRFSCAAIVTPAVPPPTTTTRWCALLPDTVAYPLDRNEGARVAVDHRAIRKAVPAAAMFLSLSLVLS